MEFFFFLFSRPPPCCDLNRPCLWLHHWLHHAEILCWHWQVFQRWGQDRGTQKDAELAGTLRDTMSFCTFVLRRRGGFPACSCHWLRWHCGLSKCEKCYDHFPQHYYKNKGADTVWETFWVIAAKMGLEWCSQQKRVPPSGFSTSPSVHWLTF